MTSQFQPSETEPVQRGPQGVAHRQEGEVADPTAVMAEAAATQGFVDKRVDLAVSAGVVGIGLFLIIGSFSIREGIVRGEIIGAAGLPRLLGAALIIAGLILVVRRVRAWRRSPLLVPSEGGDADEPGYPSTWVRPFLFPVAGLLWLVLLPRLGYVLATPLLGASLLLLATVRGWAKVIGLPLAFTVITWLLFDRFIGIQLPPGDYIGRWLDLNVPRF